MKVLHCIPSMTGGGYASFIGGGAERQCEYLCYELSRLGVEAHVAALQYGSGPNTKRLSAAATLHVLGQCAGKDLRKEQRNPAIIVRLLRLMRQIQPDVVQSWNRPMDLFAGLAAVCLSRPWILSEQCTGEMYHHGMSDRARRLMGRWASAIVSVSEGGQQYWNTYARPGTRQEVIPIMVPAQSIRLALPDVRPCLREGMPVRILYVGRFDPQKNIDLMMEALCRVAASSLPCKIVLLGDGPLRIAAQRLVDQRGLASKFNFKGFQDPPWDEMRQASMLLLVSRYEGHPNVVCEAMALGCPVIISNIPAHRALFSDRNALFVDPDSPESIVDAIEKIAADPAQALRRAAEAERLVSQWSPEALVGRYLALYTQLCGGKFVARR